ncbi:hypothetical protein [Halodesulfovibrio sp.]|nr:hypothetical protein [Halodesulfovibrio sp.]MCT4535057.1 hypothetical protein [Halodesulfovibrio sp.]
MQHLIMFLAWATPAAFTAMKMAAATACLWAVVTGVLKLLSAFIA